jgi:hypothetical protein
MPRKGSVPRHCEYCGEVFFTWPYLVRSGKRRFCSMAHALAGRTMPSGPAHVQWTGGRRLDAKGYVLVTTGPQTVELEHRVVWRQERGPIPPGHHVHHLNGVKTDNRIENLVLLDEARHYALHGVQNRLNGRWSRRWDRCQACGETERPHHAMGLCPRCHERRRAVLRRAARVPRGWSREWAACRGCGGTERPHRGKGLCNACGQRGRRRH